MAAVVSEVKPRQLQVSRLRQEEEESWISSEELHTDGSSDEETLHHTHHQPHHHTVSPLASVVTTPPPPTASEPASQDAPHLTETTRRLSELGIEELPSFQAATKDSDAQQDTAEQEHIMLWRPKRGSLKFPQLDYCTTQEKQPPTDAPASGLDKKRPDNT